ncbi:PLP-dependent aspartate aminotransferase family protein [Halobacteriovorax sp. HLS]|uniref:trans-sulfuration enzyme family protein n=1 Tax=Halobacteriovorax sp. HLS TaxID=2234000 RepID=UPI0019D449D0|nr:PLP-dependent aspartate aminotransferase family protein [Halobacteriovorax sp. HLS]
MKKSILKSLDKASKCIHVGGHPDKETGAIMPPIYQTTTYVQSSPGVHSGYEYTRSHNPTRTRLEECLAALENGKYALVTASGISSAMLVMHALPAGSTILCGDDVYGGTYRLFTTVFHELHKIVFVDTTDTKELASKIKEHKPSLLWIETPTNPLLKITDIKKVVTLAKQSKVKTLVDNTFMSPYFQNPLNLGADIVLHSMTKYINGHSDVVGGALILNDTTLYKKLWKLQNSLGPCQSPFDSWLVLRGIKTLSIRMEAHQKNALKISKWLESHPQIEKVLYPGLKSHPQHSIAKKQMSGTGGMITFFLKGNLNTSKKFLQKVNLFSLAESLGGVESLIEHPAIMTHASIPKETRLQLGIKDNLIRLSVGIENVDDLIQDLAQALNSVK